MAGTVALVGALDTKGEDFAYAKRRIERHGCRVVLIDTGVLDEPAIQADIDRGAVAEAAGVTIAELAERHDRAHAASAMSRGATVHLRRLLDQGSLDAVMGMGGGTGTSVVTAAMRELPFGLPKLMVSTVAASSNTQSYVGTSDIIMVPSVVDVAGLNRVSRSVYSRAVDAICGMVLGRREDDEGGPAADRPLVAATMFGVTTPCVSQARELLEAAGYEVLVFHANGGGKAMEQLIEAGLVDGVLDITTTEWADELVGGIRSAGPTRLDAAACAGIPQLVSVGALDMVNFGAWETVPERFAGRRFHRHNPMTTLMRTTVEESAELGRIIAGKLNKSTGPVELLLPLKGVSALDTAGESFDDPQARSALYESLKTHVDPARVTVTEVDAHINDPAFAKRAVDGLLQRLTPKRNP